MYFGKLITTREQQNNPEMANNFTLDGKKIIRKIIKMRLQLFHLSPLSGDDAVQSVSIVGEIQLN